MTNLENETFTFGPEKVSVALCECGSLHKIFTNTLYSCPRCGLITVKKITEKPICKTCNGSRSIIKNNVWNNCTPCKGKGFL